MLFIFPMAGTSSRFFRSGYTVPKYMLPITGATDVFDHVMEPFLFHKHEHKFIFITRNDEFCTSEFVNRKIDLYNLPNTAVIEIGQLSRGQAETVYIGLQKIIDQSELAIFNIDTIKLDHKIPKFVSDGNEVVDGALELFKNQSVKYSYAKIEHGYVVKTAEKRVISQYASNGMYYFKDAETYCSLFKDYEHQSHGTELYIAPMYNLLISSGGKILPIHVQESEMLFCGTPDEYEATRAKLLG